jgi:hypothetical protein
MNRTVSLPEAANNGPKAAATSLFATEAKLKNAIYPPIYHL